MKNWQELFWNYPGATEPYTVEKWQEILDGLLYSFNQHLQLRFVHAEPPRLYPNENDLSLGFDVTCSVSSPLGALNLYAIGGIEVYETEEKQIGIGADISLFVFLGDARLKAESPKNTDWTNDYIAFHFAKNDDGESAWECRGWESVYYDEWSGIKFPNKIAATNQIQIVVPDKDDERYDPYTENVVLQECPMCGDFVLPQKNTTTREMIWICQDCEAVWKKHEAFLQSNANAFCFEWSEIEELPYQNTVENVSQYGSFPLEASHICSFSSNRFDLYECQMPPDYFEQFAIANHWKMEPIKEPVCIPRYHFRTFLEEQRRILSVEELRRRLPDSPFIHKVEKGVECRQKRSRRSIQVVYDQQYETLYFYCFVEAKDDLISEKALRFHETLQKLCRIRSTE